MNDLLDHIVSTADANTTALVFVAFATREDGQEEMIYFTSGDVDECFALASVAAETLKEERDE